MMTHCACKIDTNGEVCCQTSWHRQQIRDCVRARQLGNGRLDKIPSIIGFPVIGNTELYRALGEHVGG